MENPFHFFCTSTLNWQCADDLFVALKKVEIADKKTCKSLGVKIAPDANCSVWQIPGADAGTKYQIQNFTPEIDGAEFICNTKYK
jgi:hypothetical protein